MEISRNQHPDQGEPIFIIGNGVIGKALAVALSLKVNLPERIKLGLSLLLHHRSV